MLKGSFSNNIKLLQNYPKDKDLEVILQVAYYIYETNIKKEDNVSGKCQDIINGVSVSKRNTFTSSGIWLKSKIISTANEYKDIGKSMSQNKQISTKEDGNNKVKNKNIN